jgi:hypothetical protein
VFSFGTSIVTIVLLRRENGKRSKGLRDQWIEMKSEDEIKKLGDKR